MSGIFESTIINSKGGGSSSPLTTKGDLWGYSTVDARIPAGTNGQVLQSDSTQSLGVKWVTATGTGNLTSINADATAAQLLTVGTAGTDFAVVDDAAGGHAFNLPTASGTNRGALSSANWTTFNNKAPTASPTFTGTVTLPSGTVTSSAWDTGTSTFTSNGVAFTSKLTSTLTNGNIFVGNGSNIATGVTPSGDVTITNTGVTAIGATKVTNAMLAGSITAAKLVGSDIATVGTITTGVWTGTTIAIANGGTGVTTKAAAFDALQPMSASGDIIYGGASGTGTRLPKGSDTQVLTLVSGLPAWAAAGGGGGLTIGNAVSGGGANRVLYEDGSQNLATSANFKFDGTQVIANKMLNVAATAAIDINNGSVGNARIDSNGGSSLLMNANVDIGTNGGAVLRYFHDTNGDNLQFIGVGGNNLLFTGTGRIGYGGASGTYYPPAYIYTLTGQMIGATSPPGGATPNYELEIRKQTSSDATIQLNNSDTGNTSSDGTLLIVKASTKNFIVNQQEAADIDLQIAGTSKLLVQNSSGAAIASVAVKTPRYYSKETGSNDCSGSGTLSSGTVTITTSAATTGSRIFVTDTSTGSLVNVGSLVVSTKSNGSFVVTSTNTLDASTFDWFIVQPY